MSGQSHGSCRRGGMNHDLDRAAIPHCSGDFKEGYEHEQSMRIFGRWF